MTRVWAQLLQRDAAVCCLGATPYSCTTEAIAADGLRQNPAGADVSGHAAFPSYIASRRIAQQVRLNDDFRIDET